jgi:alanine racemase
MRDAAEERSVWAWIDLEALRHNARRAMARAAGRTLIAVVKADGYGHGGAEVARALLAEGVTRLAVVSVAEGAALRRAGIVAPILLLGGLDDRSRAERAIKWGLTPVLHDERGLELARRVARGDSPLAVEVEVDTGMHRMGVPQAEAARLLAEIERIPSLHLSGLFTHLARADEADVKPSRDQVAAFAEVLSARGGGASGEDGRPCVHVANSAGLLRLEEIEPESSGLSSDAVRPGLMLYGVSPFDDRTGIDLGLRPVMTLAARVVTIRAVARGAAVGYGGEWRARRETRVATLPLGYADGIPRAVLGRGEVHLGGALCPIVGRVSMDYVTVEIGDGPVAIGDVATIFGQTPEGECVPVERFARAAGTIGYEMLVGVGGRVPRRYGEGPPPGSEEVDDAV